MPKKVSPFRLVDCKSSNFRYKGTEASVSPSSHSIACSPQCVAFTCVSNEIMVLPLDMMSSANSAPTLSGHTDTITDLSFSPFDSNLLVSCGKEGIVNVWDVANSESSQSISLERVDPWNMDFHPSTNHILAVGSKRAVDVVDVDRGAVICSSENEKNGQDFISVAWSNDGSSLCAVTKDKQFCVLDPRAGNPPSQYKLGMRPHTLLCLDDHIMLACCQNMYRAPEVLAFDLRKMDEGAFFKKKTPFQNGFSLPVYDEDTKLLCFSARGAATMVVFDLNQGLENFVPAETFIADEPFQGMAAVPKFALDLDHNEVARYMQLSSTAITPIQLKIPRRVDRFDESLYPPSRANQPAQAAADWESGSDAVPLRFKITAERSEFGAEFARIGRKKSVTSSGSAASSAAAAAVVSKSTVRLAGTVEKEEKEEEFVHETSAKRKAMDMAMKKSTFLHTSGDEPRSMKHFYSHMKPQAASKSLKLCHNIQANSKFFAFPWTVSTGSGVHVQALSPLGRCPAEISLVRGHPSQVLTFSLSTLDEHLLATGGDDANVKIWRIPDEGLSKDLTEPEATIPFTGAIRKLQFHNAVENVLAVAYDDVSSFTLSIVDSAVGEAFLDVDGHEGSIGDVQWSYDPALLATTCKDRLVRIIDPRADEITQSFEPPQCKRATGVLWGGDANQLLTYGFEDRSERSISLWDLRDASKPLATKSLGIANGNLMPFFDPDTGLLFVNEVGSKKFTIMAVSPSDGFTKLSGWSSTNSSRALGVFAFPKSSCDVRKIEVARCLRLMSDCVLPVSFSVPRKRKEFFQDDIFPPTRVWESFLSAEDWFDGKDVEIQKKSLRPSDMTPLSEAPEEEMTSRQKRQLDFLAEEKKREAGMGYLSTEQAIGKWQGMTMAAPAINRWDAQLQGDTNDIDEDEWGDDSD
eukprot:172034_1